MTNSFSPKQEAKKQLEAEACNCTRCPFCHGRGRERTGPFFDLEDCEECWGSGTLETCDRCQLLIEMDQEDELLERDKSEVEQILRGLNAND